MNCGCLKATRSFHLFTVQAGILTGIYKAINVKKSRPKSVPLHVVMKEAYS